MQSIKEVFDALDLSSRGRRRKVVALVIDLLERIRAAESAYLDRIPLNLQCSDAYDNADNSICLLDEAIDVIESIYE